MQKNQKKLKKKFANTKIVCIFASETKTNNDMNYRLTFEELSRVFANVAKLEYETEKRIQEFAGNIYRAVEFILG